MNRIERATELANEQLKRLSDFEDQHKGYTGVTQEFFRQDYEIETSWLIMTHLVQVSKGQIKYS